MLILVVDDDPMAAEMTAAIVEDADFQTLIAENGVEALEVLEQNSEVDLIISDMNMPLLNGVELFQELRGQGCKIPFILLSGDDPQAALITEPALDASLLKDFSLQESLVEVIKQVMMAS
ncbi:response regulator [bacterium]|nr:response regulator [bacterium]